MTKVTPFLMFDDQLEAALELYTSIFPDSRVEDVHRTEPDGRIDIATFIVGGQRFLAYNGGPHFAFSEATSFFVDCADQAEVDMYWDKLLAAGGTELMCGWIRDPFGLSWQIIPRRLLELRRDPDPKKSKAVVDAMLQMVKIDVATLERAHAQA